MRYTAFKQLGSTWWKWVEDNAPPQHSPSRRQVAKLLGVSYQAIADLTQKSCTLDRVYDYMTRLAEHGWPKTRIIVDGTRVELEVIEELKASA
jgi:hypothetical protein